MSTPAKGQLLRVLGPGFALAVVIGGIIGSGIMRSPGLVAAAIPDPTLIMLAWAAGGLLVLVYAFPTVELAASMPHAGGPYVFATRAYGPLTGLIVGWSDWLQGTISTAFMAVVFAEYVQRLGFGTGLSTGMIAVIEVLVLGAINLSGTRTSGMTQNIGSFLKALALVALIIAIFGFTDAAPAPAQSTGMSGAMTFAGIITAARLITGTYGGWQGAVYFLEEVKSAERNVVRATFGGILLVMAIYLLVNAALLHALPLDVLAKSNLPVADAAAIVAGPWGDTIITALAVLSVFTIANLQVMMQPRVLLGMARSRLLPDVFTRVSANGTPVPGVIFSTGLIALLAGTGSFELLVNIYAPMVTLMFAILGFAAIRMRRIEPGLARPYKMPLFPLPALIAGGVNAMFTLLFFVEDMDNARWSLLLLALPLPYYFWRKSKVASA